MRILLEIGVIIEYYAEYSTKPSEKKTRDVCNALTKAKPSLHRTGAGKVKVGLNMPDAERNKPTNKNLVQKPVRLSTELERYLNAIRKTNPRMTKAKTVRKLLEYAISSQIIMIEMKKNGKFGEYIDELDAIRTTRIRRVISKKNSLDIVVDMGMEHDFTPDTYTRIANPKFQENVVLNMPLISNSEREAVV